MMTDESQIGSVARELAAGRRVELRSLGPVDGLARAVWWRLPTRLRLRLSLATWAFGNDNGFDLAALPARGGLGAGVGVAMVGDASCTV